MAESKYCECFGETGLQASTHGDGSGGRYCDLCGLPVKPDDTVIIPLARYEALMAGATAARNAWELLRYQPRELPCETETAAKLLEHALAALRAAGIDTEEKT